jgi:hypothetical protein
MNMRKSTVVASVSLLLALSGCGGSSPSGAATGDEKPEQAVQRAALDAAQCMRDKGFDMPDPVFDSNGRASISMDGGNAFDPEDPEFREASDECNKELDKVIGDGDKRTPQEKQEFQDRVLEYAQCMRENGVDMPDPTFDDSGRTRMQMGGPGQELMEADVFEKAEAACQDKNVMGNAAGARSSKADGSTGGGR